METDGFFNYNGKYFKNGKEVISANNRSFRYGDGFFETLKVINGKIVLEKLHLERIFASVQLLKFNNPNFFLTVSFWEQVKEVVKRNKLKELARVRINIFRGDGGLYDPVNHHPNYLIQAWEMNKSNNLLNENGLVLGVFRDAIKACDSFSHLKSNNYLGYAMAALWAKENRMNDCLLLNQFDRIADSTIANIFIVKDNIIITPPISEGCIDGVMRKYLLFQLKSEGFSIEEMPITTNDLFNATEAFLTNGIMGIRWVKEIEEKNYTNDLSKVLHQKFVVPLFNKS